MKLTKKIFSITLAVVLVLSLAISASAKVVYADNGWLFEHIDADCKEFEIDKYEGSLSALETYEGFNNTPVVSIGSSAFSQNTTLTSIKINEPIRNIDFYAFLNCSSLSKVTFPSTLQTMGLGVFYGCSSLIEADLGATELTSIPKNAFRDCTSLTKVVIPKSVTSIGTDAFRNDSKVVIYCYKDSAAHKYAVEKNINFVLIDGYYVLGDADGDGEVTIMDATVVQKVLVFLIDDTDGSIAHRADIDGNGLEITDATRIQRYLAGLPNPYGIGEKIFEN